MRFLTAVTFPALALGWLVWLQADPASAQSQWDSLIWDQNVWAVPEPTGPIVFAAIAAVLYRLRGHSKR